MIRNNRAMRLVITILAVALVLVVFLMVLRSFNKSQLADQLEPVACTMDAKICADGSAVGRSGPNCEFAACPLE